MENRLCPICDASCPYVGHHSSTDSGTGYREDADLWKCPAHGLFDDEESLPSEVACEHCDRVDDPRDMEQTRSGWLCRKCAPLPGGDER